MARKIRVVIAKPGLDGHSNGAEQVAVAARDAGMEVIYSGIRLTLEQIAAAARDEDPDVIGLSATTYCYGFARDNARKIKESLGVPVVIGGPHVTLAP